MDKKTFLLGCLLSLALLGLRAQTDVTDLYLTNAGFDDSSSWQTTNVKTTSSSNSLAVKGWTVSSTAEWVASAAFGYGGTGQINGVAVPSKGYKNSTGGALGISVGWGAVCKYTQKVKLPAGHYRISYALYNGNSATQAANYIGFEPNSGTPTYGAKSTFSTSIWSIESVYLCLGEETTGNICVGIGAVSGSSTDNAKVLIDYVKIEAFNSGDPLASKLDNNITPGAWTGQTGTYQDTYVEYYHTHHFVGDKMQSVTSVPNGTYTVELYFQANCADWSCTQVATDGDKNAYIRANDVFRYVPVYNSKTLTSSQPTLYTLSGVKVTDGKLVVTVGNSNYGANWLTAKMVSIKKTSLPTIGFGAFALPTDGPVVADFWYVVDIPIDGIYTLTVDGEATVSYAQSPSVITSALFSTTTGGAVSLKAGSLYLKADAAVPISINADEVGKLMLSYKVGDVNNDKTVSVDDIFSLVEVILGNQTPEAMGRVLINDDMDVSVADVSSLTDIVLGRTESATINHTADYVKVSGKVYAEQSSSENASGAAYTKTSAVSTVTGRTVSVDMADHLTTLRIAVPNLTDVLSVSVFSRDQTPIAGLFTRYSKTQTVTTSAGAAVDYASSMLSDVVTVTGTDAGTYVAYLMPVELAKGVTVTVRTSSGQYYSQDFTSIKACAVNELNFTQTSASNRWMSTIPGNVPFTFLSIPGAHDAATKGTSSGIAECQSLSVPDLLAAGVRSLDLRPSASSSTQPDDMLIYHGSVNTGVYFKDALADVSTFLKNNPSETVFILIHEEDGNNLDAWRNSVQVCLQRVMSRIKVIDDNMTLDDCRGRMVVIARDDVSSTTNFCGKCGWGSSFSDKTVFYGTSDATVSPWTLVYQDEYNYSSDYATSRIANIEKLVTDCIVPNEKDADRIFYNTANVAWYFWSASASQITTTARAVNRTILNSTTLQNSTGRWGILSGDYMGNDNYYGKQLLDFIINQNFKYVYRGRSRVTP